MKAKYESKEPCRLVLVAPDGIELAEWTFTSELNAHFDAEEILDIFNEAVKEGQIDAQTSE